MNLYDRWVEIRTQINLKGWIAFMMEEDWERYATK